MVELSEFDLAHDSFLTDSSDSKPSKLQCFLSHKMLSGLELNSYKFIFYICIYDTHTHTHIYDICYLPIWILRGIKINSQVKTKVSCPYVTLFETASIKVYFVK